MECSAGKGGLLRGKNAGWQSALRLPQLAGFDAGVAGLILQVFDFLL